MGWAALVVVVILRAMTLLYDVLTFPIYLISQKPWRRLRDHKESKVNFVQHNEADDTRLGFILIFSFRHN